jgi:hypothetical protein
MDELDSWLTSHDYYAAENVPGDEYEAYLASPALMSSSDGGEIIKRSIQTGSSGI